MPTNKPEESEDEIEEALRRAAEAVQALPAALDAALQILGDATVLAFAGEQPEPANLAAEPPRPSPPTE